MKNSIFLLTIGLALLAGCKKSSTTTYCYRCNTIQYGSATVILDTVNTCGVGYGNQGIAYQKGDSIIYQFGAPSNDTTRCFKYAQ